MFAAISTANGTGSCLGAKTEFFSEPYPARSTVEVARLPKDLRVEIEAIAVR